MSELDRFLMALCIWREARGEPVLGQLHVAAVIINRAFDLKHRWPTTIADVVTQPFQFSAFNAGDPNALLFPKSTDQTWTVALEIADLERVAALNLPSGINHYHAQGIAPSWAKASAPATTVGRHLFYRL